MKRINFLLLVLLSLTISACNKSSSSSFSSEPEQSSETTSAVSSEPSEVTSATSSESSITSSELVTVTYTVTWQNFDETVLKVDYFEEGEFPVYSGATPTKPATSETYFVFSGWTPSLAVVTSDAKYTATYTARLIDEEVPGVDPVFSSDFKTLHYGFYPQSYVKDNNVITSLNNLNIESNNLCLLDGVYYTKEEAKVYNNENYTFNDGTTINNGESYWFTLEPIKWDVLSASDGSYYLLSSLLLDARAFYTDYNDRVIDSETIYANNYKHSTLRTWLNRDFYNNAFFLNSSYIKKQVVDNSASSTDSLSNIYASSDTSDAVFLPSYQDYLNSSYGFSNTNDLSPTRTSKTTDYARARGAWINTTNTNLNGNGSYWTRSATSEYYYTAWNVNSGGYLSMYAVDGSNHSVRPSIIISFQ